MNRPKKHGVGRLGPSNKQRGENPLLHLRSGVWVVVCETSSFVKRVNQTKVQIVVFIDEKKKGKKKTVEH